MDGVGTPIIGRPRPLPGHDTPNPAHNTYTLKFEEPFSCVVSSVKGVATTPRIWRVFQNVRARYGVTVERVQVVGVSVPVSLRKLTGTVCT